MSRPTLSYCLVTDGPAARVQGLLALVRPHVDEIVLAVDQEGDLEATLDACAHLADRRLTLDVSETSSGVYGWARHQCAGDWVLQLDDDEVPSAALLEALPGLVADRTVTHYDLRRRWLYPGRDRYLSSPPWNVEFQRRLLRNLPGVWRPGGGAHDIGSMLGDRRLLDLGFYHCDLILNPEAKRRGKSVYYENLRPGLRFGAFSVNSMYTPELFDDIDTDPVPAADLEILDRVLDHTATPAASVGAPAEAAAPAEVATYNAQPVLPESAYRAQLTPIGLSDYLPASTVWHFELLVANHGDARWPSGENSHPLVRVGLSWRRRGGGEIVGHGRALFPELVAPGQTTRVLVETTTPAEPGPYTLELDLVHEHVRWFGCGHSTPIGVEPAELARYPRPRRAHLDAELRAEIRRLRSQEREAAGRACDLEAVTRTRTYRVMAALVRPLDELRLRGR